MAKKLAALYTREPAFPVQAKKTIAGRSASSASHFILHPLPFIRHAGQKAEGTILLYKIREPKPLAAAISQMPSATCCLFPPVTRQSSPVIQRPEAISRDSARLQIAIHRSKRVPAVAGLSY
ncbi:MAG TPA: hypothetical protein VGW37_09990 [Terriglobia bacterium]|nr:hypothetical protein [Terriglobia bacterium]